MKESKLTHSPWSSSRPTGPAFGRPEDRLRPGDRHRSREFVEFLGLLDAAYPAATAIKIILDNHSAHIWRETKAWLEARPQGRFHLVFTPKHGSWLNLVEGFFAKAARSVLRHIRVGSKHELKQRITEFIDDLNRDPVIHRWHYQIDAAA